MKRKVMSTVLAGMLSMSMVLTMIPTASFADEIPVTNQEETASEENVSAESTAPAETEAAPAETEAAAEETKAAEEPAETAPEETTEAETEAAAETEAPAETEAVTEETKAAEEATEAAPEETETAAEETEATAEETETTKEETAVSVDYSAYQPGVTVEADANSPTGYTATFIYQQQESYTKGDITITDPVKVELYSDCMMLFTYAEGCSADTAYSPDQYTADKYPAGGSTATAYFVEMTEFTDGLWGTQIPLSSGAFVYNFQVTDADGNVISRLDDPSNPTLTNTATGIRSLSSMVYVPYDTVQGTGAWKDRSVETPVASEAKGTVETISYTGASGDTRGLAVYLPYGYDASRTEPYKILYLSHGASGDSVGNELRWMNEGAVANIMDNIIAEGKNEPFVVVTMNNQDLGWNQDKIWAEQEIIMDLIESKYNVRTDADGKAFAGLSMGGITTSNMYVNHTDEFSYYGIWSASNVNLLTDEKLAELTNDHVHIMVGGGAWDFGLTSCKNFAAKLNENGIATSTVTVPGAHDWETWQLLYAYAAENFFWKTADSFDYSSYEPGVTVIEDSESPTGYSGVFVYKEQESYTKGDLTITDPVKVELYSDCMMLFSYENGYGADKAYSPDEYTADKYPAGGSTATAYYTELFEFAEGYWCTKIPLSSGAFVYNFQVTDCEGNVISRLDDPSNPTMTNTATGIRSLSSMVYVPYSEKQGTGAWKDRTVETPVAEQKGTVDTIAYTGAAGDTRGLAIYLPYGYDANRTEPYKVLYLSHGASGDKVGNELRWMNEGAVANIMDNIIAEGKNEPFVVVTMNSQDLGWNQDKIWAEQEIIMDLIESKYNVRTDADGRAFAGLSMGGYTTSTIYCNHTEDFGWYGIWSYANTSLLTDEKLASLAESDAQLMFGAGEWDMLRSPVETFASKVGAVGVDYDIQIVPGAHDWETWQLLYAYAAENFFFKDVEVTATDASHTIESGKSATINADGDASKLQSVAVDGVEVPAEYIVTSTNADGTQAITIKSAYLDQLTAGDHKVTVTYGKSDGGTRVAESTLTIKAAEKKNDQKTDDKKGSDTKGSTSGGSTTPASSPKTGDTGSMGLWLLLMAASAACAALLVFRKRA